MSQTTDDIPAAFFQPEHRTAADRAKMRQAYRDLADQVGLTDPGLGAELHEILGSAQDTGQI